MIVMSGISEVTFPFVGSDVWGVLLVRFRGKKMFGAREL